MLDQNKPHKGKSSGHKVELTEDGKAFSPMVYGPNLGYYYQGRFLGHPRFGFSTGTTSLVVAEKDGEVETLNSRYTLVE